MFSFPPATGSVNFPTRVYDNTPDLVDRLAGEMLERGIKPEIEAFDLSMIFQAACMQALGRLAGALRSPGPMAEARVLGLHA